MAIRNTFIVIMVAVGAHSLKEVSRTQLAGVVKLYGTPEEKREVLKLDKKKVIGPVAKMFIREGIITVEGAGHGDCDRNNVIKTGVH